VVESRIVVESFVGSCDTVVAAVVAVDSCDTVVVFAVGSYGNVVAAAAAAAYDIAAVVAGGVAGASCGAVVVAFGEFAVAVPFDSLLVEERS